jgi:hypothetical protein
MALAPASDRVGWNLVAFCKDIISLSVSRHSRQIPMLPHADHAQEKADHGPQRGHQGTRLAELEAHNHDRRAYQRCSGVDIHTEYSWNPRQQHVANRPAAYACDGTHEDGDERRNIIGERFARSRHSKQREARGI